MTHELVTSNKNLAIRIVCEVVVDLSIDVSRDGAPRSMYTLGAFKHATLTKSMVNGNAVPQPLVWNLKEIQPCRMSCASQSLCIVRYALV